MDGVAHLRHFGKHHGGAGTDQKICGESQGRIGCYPRERIAAAALHADHQRRRRAGFAAALVQYLEARVGHLYDVLDDFAKAGEAFVLHAHDFVVGAHALGQQQFRLQLLAAEAYDHYFAAEIGIAGKVLQRADRHRSARRVDRDPAAIGMRDRHHVVDVGISGQQLLANPVQCELDGAGDALHAGRDREDVAGADRTIGIAIAFERMALQRRQRDRVGVRLRQIVERRRVGHLHQRLLDPTAFRDRRCGMADDLAVAANDFALSDIGEGNLVSLRNLLDQPQPAGEFGARVQTAAVRDDRDVIVRVHADVERFRGGGLHVESLFAGVIRSRVAARHDRGNQSQTACVIKRPSGKKLMGYELGVRPDGGINPRLTTGTDGTK
jgi:hypothetical protein